MFAPSKKVAKKVTKEMEYDYKTGKKSFAGSTAKKDAHAEKEGKIVAKHAAYDKDMDMMRKGGKVKKMAKGGIAASSMGKVATKPGNINGVATKGLTKGKMIKMCGGGKM